MIFYLSYYIIVGSILTFGYIIKNKIFTYIVLLLILLVSGLRYEVGYDWFNYVSFFEGISLDRIEPLFGLTINLLSLISDEPALFFFFYSTLIILVTYVAIRKLTTSHRTALMIYLLIPGLYLNSFSIIRQSIAISLFFLGIYYLFENRKKEYFSLAVVAVLFHYSAIIPFLFVFAFRKWLLKKHLFKHHIIVLIIAFVLSYFNISGIIISFTGKYSVYAELLLQEISLIKVFTLVIFSGIILWAFRNNEDSKNNLLLNIFQIGIISNVLFYSFAPVTRIGYYFLITQVILIPHIVYFIRKEEFKIYALSFFFLYFFAQQINALNVDEQLEEYPKMTPYRNYINE